MSQNSPPDRSPTSTAVVPAGFATAELQQLIHEAIQATPDGIGIFDPDDRLVFSNAALASLFGLGTAQALGMSFDDLVRQAYVRGDGIHIETADIEQWLSRAKKKRRSSSYRSFQTDTRDGRWVQLTEQLTDSGHMFVFFTDITQQKQVERKLQQLTCKLKVHAETDELTGINNRRHFFHLAEKELRRCQRTAQGVALLLLDVDHFKQVNDQHGHQQGDRVLCRICHVLRPELRSYDVLGRIGGEEFALLIPQAGAQQALEIAERLRRRVAAIEFGPLLPELRTSVSIGVAASSAPGEAINGLVARADKALYRAKHAGRNCCALADNGVCDDAAG